jgi:hypothetical protein
MGLALTSLIFSPVYLFLPDQLLNQSIVLDVVISRLIAALIAGGRR